MEISVIVFPGSNCDRDVAVSLKKVFKRNPKMVWHKEQTLPKSDLIVLPGGFSYGDYLRCGSMAANSPIMSEIIKCGENGTFIIGICNGFQILTETNLLPGTLIRNRDLSFICKNLPLKVENSKSRFTHKYSANEIIEIPVAHNEGNYFTSPDHLKELKDKDLLAFKYCNSDGEINSLSNPNGSIENIAGIFNSKKNILGMMPHPERMIDNLISNTDGINLFTSLIK